MTTTEQADVGTDGRVSDELVAAYREHGFVRVRGVLDPDQVERFRSSAEAFLTAHRGESLEKQGAFSQLVNVWQHDDDLRALTFDVRLGRVAEQLAGFPLRLWHDQMLVKEPHNNVATEFHQDRPYWPHASDRLALSAWIALVDVPPERGCMTFLPGTQHRTGLRPQDLHHEDDLFALDPSLRWVPRVTVPLRRPGQVRARHHLHGRGNDLQRHRTRPHRPTRPRPGRPPRRRPLPASVELASQLPHVQQRPDVQTAANVVAPQRVDDRGHAEPAGPGLLDELVDAQGLTAGVDPVVDDEHRVRGSEEVLAETKGEMAVPVVRGCGLAQPGVAVARRCAVLADLDEADTQTERDERAEEATA
jgi:phytanoyl-CoA hydroxylase